MRSRKKSRKRSWGVGAFSSPVGGISESRHVAQTGKKTDLKGYQNVNARIGHHRARSR